MVRASERDRTRETPPRARGLSGRALGSPRSRRDWTRSPPPLLRSHARFKPRGGRGLEKGREETRRAFIFSFPGNLGLGRNPVSRQQTALRGYRAFPPRGRNPSSSPSGSGDRSTAGPPGIPCRSPRAHLAACCGQNYLRVAGSSLPLTDTPTSPSKLEGTAPSDLETNEAGQETLSSFPRAGSLIRGWQKSSCASHALPSSRVSERITSIPPTSQHGCAHSFIIHSVNYFLLSTYYVPDTVLPQMM
ncbi:uncharacterized protein [Symphalangus syndactylus]|uniref:uncharacterized protein n=1 Tax=Symphalangus syndactylus TaxID=9590 RepID=UPI002442FA5C|nr:uncharacterized protein LOC129488731 [Symphalangus syndactylus]